MQRAKNLQHKQPLLPELNLNSTVVGKTSLDKETENRNRELVEDVCADRHGHQASQQWTDRTPHLRYDVKSTAAVRRRPAIKMDTQRWDMMNRTGRSNRTREFVELY
jgi:hypothetical protein